MDRRHLKRTELIAMVGGLLLAACIFVPTYTTDAGNPNSSIGGVKGDLSVWDVHPILRWLLLLAASAPFVLAWIIARGHTLSWARGELTAVVAIAAFGLVVYNAVIDPPSGVGVTLTVGFFGLVAGTVLMVFGAATRSGESERTRKPPGVL